ncbi:hypothetical protein FDUTEX481_06975 [Tolypothrix sp. PCC 7601]|nr:hypothetical protein FDUTEX481_06975 [Tolypothrix sp. PCC 7601]
MQVISGCQYLGVSIANLGHICWLILQHFATASDINRKYLFMPIYLMKNVVLMTFV